MGLVTQFQRAWADTRLDEYGFAVSQSCGTANGTLCWKVKQLDNDTAGGVCHDQL
jgi:hypothetical protein